MMHVHVWRDPRVRYDDLSDHTTEPRPGTLLASQGLPVRVIILTKLSCIFILSVFVTFCMPLT